MEYNNQKFINQFKAIIEENAPRKILFVASRDYDRYGYRAAIDDMGIDCIAFTEFSPCPEVSSAKKGAEIFKQNNCDFIITVGGGSAMDVAKAIKLFAETDVKILAVPTTAGTGAEVTRFAVLYNHADKDSVRSWDIIPNFQVFDYTALKSLPEFQRIVTSLDVFCHSVEAYWSTDATDESRAYSMEALELFGKYFQSYMDDDASSYEPMMKCSELAGRAINIAQTTSPHAFSYKLHKIKGFVHGEAVAVSLCNIWKYMLENCPTPQLQLLLAETEILSGFTPDSFEKFIAGLGIHTKVTITKTEFDETVNGVNVSRLANNPMTFDANDIKNIYSQFITITD